MRERLDAAYSIIRRTGIPDGWTEHEITDVVRIIGGGTPDRNVSTYWRDGEIPWITPTDLTANVGKYISEGAEHISQAGLRNSNATLVPIGSIVFSTRGTVGNMAIAAVPLTCNQSCEVLVPKSGGLNSEFLYYLLTYGMSAFHRLAGGTTFGAITRREVGRVRFAFPPDNEQTAITNILNAVDVSIERTQDALKRAQTLDHSLLNDLLEHGIGVARTSRRPTRWQVKRVDEVAEVGSGVTLGKDVSGFRCRELPYLRVANVQDGHLNLDSVKMVRVRTDEVDRYRLEPGDVLMTEGGDLDKLGRGTLWEGQIPDCLHQNHIFRVRANRALLSPRFFSYVIESDIAKRYFNRVAKRTTNLASTNKTQVRAFRFPVPPLDEQEQIAALIAANKATVNGLQTKESALKTLKRSLMHDLLTGAVRIKPSALQELTPA